VSALWGNDAKRQTELQATRAFSVAQQLESRQVFEDHSGNLWIGSNGGLDRLTVNKKGVFQISRQTGVLGMSAQNGVNAIAETQDRKIWIVTDNGLYSWHTDSGNKRLFTHTPEQPGSLSYNKISALYVDKTNTLWVGRAYISREDAAPRPHSTGYSDAGNG
jgi:ligand-binding sensor domain-containing protein